MKTVLITGGAGFIGYHLAHYHAAAGDQVIIFDNLAKQDGTSDPEYDALKARPNVACHQLDLALPIPADLEVGRLDVVYHLAAINGTRLFYEQPYAVARTNSLLTLNLLDWLESQDVERLVYSSSSEVYAGAEHVDALEIPTSERVPVVFTQPLDDRFSYGATKFIGEVFCLTFAVHTGLSTSIVRYHNIYGPRMGDKHVIPELSARIASGESPCRIYGGSETRAFCYVSDAVEATARVAESDDCDGAVVHIGNSQEEIEIRELATLLAGKLGIDVEFDEQGRRSASVSRRCPDTGKLESLTGFTAQVSLEEGLDRTLDWYGHERAPAPSPSMA